MKKTLYTAILAALAACSGGGDDRPTLSVSIEPQRRLLEEIVGDNYRVVTLLGNGANPETYDPSLSSRMAAEQSAVYFTTGHMPFEQTVASALGPDTRVVDTSAGIEPVTGTHSHGHDDHGHGDTDPHVWTSVRNARQMAANMLDAVVQLDPANAPAYRERYARLAQRLDSLDAATAERLAAAGAHAFVVWHPSLSYYARDYGLHQISVGQESKEQTIGRIGEMISEVRADSARVFFFQQEYDSRQAQSINREMGTRLVTINPLAYDWENEITLITDELTR